VPEPASGWRGLPASVTATTGTRDDGSRVHFLNNWSWDEVSVPVGAGMRDVLGDEVLEAGETLVLGAWDVRVLAEGNA
jgi:beta-galactosidase